MKNLWMILIIVGVVLVGCAPQIRTYGKIYPNFKEEQFVTVGATMMGKESCEEYRSSTGGHHTCESYELVYLGRVGDSIRIGYREFTRNMWESGGRMARPAYSMEATYPTRSKIITFRNIRIEIIEISDDGLKYKLISVE